MVNLITYDIFDKSRDLSELEAAIKSTGTWWHHISNVWIIQTDESPNEMYNRLFKHFRAVDTVYIVTITSNHQGWLNKKGWDWFNGLRY